MTRACTSQDDKIFTTTERTPEENKERAYIAASRRSKRSLEDRIKSARKASEIHKVRTGRSLIVTEQAVVNQEVYGEELNWRPKFNNIIHPPVSHSSDRLRRLAAIISSQEAAESSAKASSNGFQQLSNVAVSQPEVITQVQEPFRKQCSRSTSQSQRFYSPFSLSHQTDHLPHAMSKYDSAAQDVEGASAEDFLKTNTNRPKQNVRRDCTSAKPLSVGQQGIREGISETSASLKATPLVAQGAVPAAPIGSLRTKSNDISSHGTPLPRLPDLNDLQFDIDQYLDLSAFETNSREPSSNSLLPIATPTTTTKTSSAVSDSSSYPERRLPKLEQQKFETPRIQRNDLTMLDFHISTPDGCGLPQPGSFNNSPTQAQGHTSNDMSHYTEIQAGDDYIGYEDDVKSSPSRKLAVERHDANITPNAFESCRFQTVLNCSTAMLRNGKGASPMTYLNISQIYTISIEDTKLEQASIHSGTYRTFIRVFFEDKKSRANPDSCWRLWSEGRRTNKTTGQIPYAVEYVGPLEEAEDTSSAVTVLEDQQLDGFIVKWTAAPGQHRKCSIGLRFNFLSTAFTHIKGVKGVGLRLCAKTSVDEPSSFTGKLVPETEICFSRIKVFRNYGAGRKLASDEAHTKKHLETLEKRLEKAKRTKDVAYRSALGNPKNPKPSSTKITQELNDSIEECKSRLQSQSCITSFSIRGLQDDPDLCPIIILDEVNSCTIDNAEASKSDRQVHRKNANHAFENRSEFITQDIKAGVKKSGDSPRTDDLTETLHKLSPIESIERMRAKRQIDVLGIDPSYQPSAESLPRPTSCFYIQLRDAKKKRTTELYRAIYLYKRSLHAFIEAAAVKYSFDPSLIRTTIRINEIGDYTGVNDDTIFTMSEDQYMGVEFEILKPGGRHGTVIDSEQDVSAAPRYKLILRY